MQFELPPNVDPKADWLSRPFACYDTETTGVERNARLVEIAIVQYDAGGQQTSEWSTLVNPQVPIPTGAQKVHKISDKMVKDAPVFDQALYQEIVRRFKGHTLIAYNMPFDFFILYNEAKRIGKPWGQFFGVDALVLARKLFPNLKGGYAQTNVLKQKKMFDESNPNHRALQDTKDTASLLFSKLIPEFSKKHVTFQQIWNRQVELALQHEKRMRIRRAGKKTNTPWHDLAQEI